jgi:hypothetical protein
MGASASIEVSFVDKSTGEFLSQEKIASLTEEANKIVESFDFSPSFYANYNDPEKYRQLAENWKKTQINIKY